MLRPIFWRWKGALTAAVHLSETDWRDIGETLDARGWAVLPGLLTHADCDAVIGLYGEEAGFRSRVVMASHGFGRGEYKYFAYPLPKIVAHLRVSLYPHLAPLANRWHVRMGLETRFPDNLEEFLERCHTAGQTRSTPLLLQYREGDYNCLHQDLYGEHVFPLQVAILLSEPGKDFSGGDFILTEQRPRMQSRADVATLRKGDGIVFAVNDRPVKGSRGNYRVKMRHGVGTLHSGRRHTLGIIFHDAT
jgi:hypothetical protein